MIRDHISRDEIQANTSDMNPAPPTAPTTANPVAPPTQIQVSGATVALETQSVLLGHRHLSYHLPRGLYPWHWLLPVRVPMDQPLPHKWSRVPTHFSAN